jgi:hypothetical protein
MGFVSARVKDMQKPHDVADKSNDQQLIPTTSPNDQSSQLGEGVGYRRPAATHPRVSYAMEQQGGKNGACVSCARQRLKKRQISRMRHAPSDYVRPW